jgi:hypothetical protein
VAWEMMIFPSLVFFKIAYRISCVMADSNWGKFWMADAVAFDAEWARYQAAIRL